MIRSDNPILLNPVPMSDDQKDCIDKLEQCLEQATLGNVLTIGIIVCMRTGFATTIGGTDAGSLNLGCDALKARILEHVTDEGVKPRPGVSSIIKGGRQ
jgi:hypothetical protein